MGGRYLMTGVQLGLLKASLKDNESKDIGLEVVETIEKDQFIGNSSQPILEDVDTIELWTKED